MNDVNPQHLLIMPYFFRSTTKMAAKNGSHHAMIPPKVPPAASYDYYTCVAHAALLPLPSTHS